MDNSFPAEIPHNEIKRLGGVRPVWIALPERAESVRTYLVDKGVAKKRMVAKGFGPEKPLAKNDTEEGREQNRRVEFNIVKQGPIKTVVQDE